MSTWLPALDGIIEKLQNGAKVADVGCGHGASTVLMAEAFPNSRFFGFDSHRASIETARQRAEAAGVAEQIVFQEVTAKAYTERNFRFDLLFRLSARYGRPGGGCPPC